MKPIKKFNRFELKYLLPREIVEDLKKELKKYMQKDPYGVDGRYGLASLYYDTDDYRFYWEKIEGLKFRRKLRVRRYVDEKPFTKDSIVYVEIKQRVNKVTQKRRVPLRYEDAMKFCNEGIIPPHKKEDAGVIEEIEVMLRTGKLKPKVITSYEREAWFGGDYDLGLRVTFDTDVSYCYEDLDLAKNEREGLMISPDMVIMEIKANERIPYWITELVAKNNFRLIRVSKYCQGLETAKAVPKSFYHVF